jgi:hypothetical protein
MAAACIVVLALIVLALDVANMRRCNSSGTAAEHLPGCMPATMAGWAPSAAAIAVRAITAKDSSMPMDTADSGRAANEGNSATPHPRLRGAESITIVLRP